MYIVQLYKEDWTILQVLGLQDKMKLQKFSVKIKFAKEHKLARLGSGIRDAVPAMEEEIVRFSGELLPLYSVKMTWKHKIIPPYCLIIGLMT